MIKLLKILTLKHSYLKFKTILMIDFFLNNKSFENLK